MKMIFSIMIISIFLTACSEEKQNEIADKQTDRQIERQKAADKARNDEINARQEAKKRTSTSSFKRIDPYAKLREEGAVAPLEGSKAEQIKTAKKANSKQ